MSDPAHPPPDLLEEIVAILTDDATYDEPIQARVHMVKNVLRGADLEFEDAVVATALSMSTPLGLLAGDARERVQAICDAAGLSITTIESKGGFVTDVDELITVAAYQATRADLLPKEKEQRLLYLYGGASEDLDLDVGPEAFKDRVSERAASAPPERSDLPARAAAAEIKQQRGLSQADAREAVQRLLVLDPAVAHDQSADTEADAEPDPDTEPAAEPFDAAGPPTRSGPAATDAEGTADAPEPDPIDPDLVEFWGCPFCPSTNDSLGSIKAHITGASRPPHKGVNGHKPSHHIPGYDGSGVLMAAFEQWVQDESSSVQRASTIRADGWFTEAQAAAARADVPIQTQHTEDAVERAPETDEILSTVATASADHSPTDQPGATEPSEDTDAGEDTATSGDQTGTDPEIAPGETTSPTTDPAEDPDPTPVASADPDSQGKSSSGKGADPPESTPRSADTASADATTEPASPGGSPAADAGGQQERAEVDATDSKPAWTTVPEDDSDGAQGTDEDPVTPTQSSTESGGTADEIPSTFLPDDDTTGDTPADAPADVHDTEQTGTVEDDPAGTDHQTAGPGEQETEAGDPAPDQQGGSSEASDEDSTDQDDKDSGKAWGLEAPGLRIADEDDTDGEEVADVEIRSLDDREAVLETALAIHHHERIPNGEKPDLLATLVEDATVDVDPQTVREHLADAPAPDDHRPTTQSHPTSKAAGTPESGDTDADGRGDDPHQLGSDEMAQASDSAVEWTIEVREDRLETPVGTVSTQGDLADAAVRVYRSSVIPADQCPAVVRAMAQRAGEIGIAVTAEDLFEMLSLRLDQDPRAQADSGAGDDQSLTAEAVHDRAATILRDDSLSTDEKVDRIQDIVSQATEQGIEVSLEEVLTAAKAKRQDSNGGS